MTKHPAPHDQQKEEPLAELPGSAEHRENIRRLKAKSSRGLYAMAAFIAVSIGAIRDFDFLPTISPQVRTALGTPPSANMISTALLLYAFSAIILILSRMMGGSHSYSGMAHVGYLSGFYIFYSLGGTLADNIWAVFAAGITILGLESYHIWTFCNEEIRKEMEALEESSRKQRLQQ
ncbi:Yip1 family protein [Geotalea sp. SG265]|uniref:Yip1 family protein n=1 Tax=Geotalea sp. SG265 TaxID=2922867 RepID=UPI001FAF4B0F|nr:Yip1 family protein [Geotalea sp. SG265]